MHIFAGQDEVDYMRKATILVFEILEKAWALRDCALIDMKIEFGVDTEGMQVKAKLWYTCGSLRTMRLVKSPQAFGYQPLSAISLLRISPFLKVEWARVRAANLFVLFC